MPSLVPRPFPLARYTLQLRSRPAILTREAREGSKVRFATEEAMASSLVDSSALRLTNKISLDAHLDEQQQREYEALVC